jgi:uncharacterized protein YndB with AHSA1/START domain
VEPVTVDITIDLPREEVFEYLADIANHPEFMDHFTSEWRLTRVDSYGQGAGARFHLDAPLNRFSWGDISFVEVKPPFRILGVGRGGKYNRNKLWWEWRLDPVSGGSTKVTFTAESEGALPSDRLVEGFMYRAWFKRNARKALARLQSILEEGKDRGVRATVAGLSAPAGAFEH